MNYQQPTTKAPEIEIVYKTKVQTGMTSRITNTGDVYNIMFAVGEMNRNLEYKEMFYAIYLNRNTEILALHKISEGTTDTAPVDIKFILQGAILTNATDLIICHNHPSGSTKPSPQDRTLTKRIKEAADLFGVRLLDSVIITTFNYFSFAEENIL